jgi:hypothetical protein
MDPVMSEMKNSPAFVYPDTYRVRVTMKKLLI